jgi:hypothetical protein
VAEDFDPGALLARSYELPNGLRVCLRLARVRDQGAIEQLFARTGRPVGDLEIARAVRSDPRQQVAICATALVGYTETVLGFGAIAVAAAGDPAGPRPWLLVVDETEGLATLLTGGLIGRALALHRARAA